MNDSELKNAWKAQPTAPLVLDTAQLEKRARRFRLAVRLRNAVEYAAGLFVMAVFLWYAWRFPGVLMRTGSLLAAVGVGVVLWQLHCRASARALLPDTGAACIDFHRADLERQRDALRSVWRWYIAPLVPGVVVFRWGVETELADSTLFARGPGANLVIAGVFIAVILLNLWGAHRLQKRIDALKD